MAEYFWYFKPTTPDANSVSHQQEQVSGFFAYQEVGRQLQRRISEQDNHMVLRLELKIKTRNPRSNPLHHISPAMYASQHFSRSSFVHASAICHQGSPRSPYDRRALRPKNSEPQNAIANSNA